MGATTTDLKVRCYHCGEECQSTLIRLEEKSFCCEGCKMVFQILNQNGLCEYYHLNENPGLSQKIQFRQDKFAFLEDPVIQQKLISFSDSSQTHVSFYLPQMHCSSCLWLLEHLHQLEPGIVSSKVNFTRKEVSLVYDPGLTSLRKVAEILTGVGYEPYISLNDLDQHRPRTNRSMLYRLGVAGFCFGNIMMMSFPEYLGLQSAEKVLQHYFRTFNFILSLPVFLYSAYPFYQSAYKSLRHRFLNIDAPIALAIIVTFVRSAYEVLSGTGPGYFDSMTGIVFFMLAGRVLQNKTYDQLSFERDYTSYFPIAVTRLKDEKESPVALPQIKPGDTLLIHHEELIPADGIITRGKALIDYSFVTGESTPIKKEMGEIVYAGGKQTSGNMEILVVKEVAQSYLTNLWNRDELRKTPEEKSVSFVHALSRAFTYIVLGLALAGAIYWAFHDSSRAWNVITTVLIVACPCALLLSNTFTNGNILRILGRNQFFLRGPQTIEDLAAINHIVFDKTGTLTSTRQQDLDYHGKPLSGLQIRALVSLAAQSAHPLSKALAQQWGQEDKLPVDAFAELQGKGLQGIVQGQKVRLGSKEFIRGSQGSREEGTRIYIAFNNDSPGYFQFQNHYRESVPQLLENLKGSFKLSVISGDNATERQNLQQLLGPQAVILFHQQPEDKLNYINQLQKSGDRVLMLGDGLNDAGALRQSNVGVALTENSNNFTPASDAIIEAGKIGRLPVFLKICRANKRIVMASFVLSILYNVIGLYFALQGVLSPLIAAILMPSSSLSILLVTFGSSNLAARVYKL